MKIIKLILTFTIIMILNKLSYSYIVHVNNPSHCEDYPTHLNYPPTNFNVDFYIQREHDFDTQIAQVRIYVNQNGASVMMYQHQVQANQNLSTAINLLDFPGLCFNEKIRIIVEAIPLGFLNFPFYGYGFCIIHKPEINCSNGTVSNGVATLNLHNVIGTFYCSGQCCPVSSNNYIIDQYRIRLTLNGNFNNSVILLDTNLCLGFSGGLPNYQHIWARIVSQTNTQIIFETFVYYLKNFTGQEIGWVPCRPEQAKIVYHFCSPPVLDSLIQWPTPLTPRNNVSFVFAYAHPYYPNTGNHWSQQNNNYNIEFAPMGNHARVKRSIWNHQIINENFYPTYNVCYFSSNDCGISDEDCYTVIFGTDPHECPEVSFNIDSFKIIENNILNTSPLKPGTDVIDKYILNCLFLPGKEYIEFEVSEAGDDETKLDLLELHKYTMENKYSIAFTNNGKEVTYENNPNKYKILCNNNEDLSFLLSKKDDKVKSLEKGDRLDVSFIPDGSKYIILHTFLPKNKDNISGTIKTNKGEEYSFFSRNYESSVCLEINEKDFSGFELVAEQPFIINQLQVVKGDGYSIKNNLYLKNAYDKSGDIKNKITSADGNYEIITKDNNADFVFLNTKDTGQNLKSYFVISAAGRYQDSGIKETKIINSKSALPVKYNLFDNLPNPFNPVTNIKFEIPINGIVKLTVFDITGREIKLLLDEFKIAGQYNVKFDGSNYSSGIYFYKMEINDYTETKRMILIK